MTADDMGDIDATLMLHKAQALNGLLDDDLPVVGPTAAEGTARPGGRRLHPGIAAVE